MSEKSSSCFQKHVGISDVFKNRTLSLKWKPQLSPSMKKGIEFLSAFCWIIMLLWIQSGCITLYFFIFVSFIVKGRKSIINISLTVQRRNNWESLLHLLCDFYVHRQKGSRKRQSWSGVRNSHNLKSYPKSFIAYRSEYVRTLSWYRHFCDYFPASVIKTAELPPDRNYLFGMYPHGVIRCAILYKNQVS